MKEITGIIKTLGFIAKVGKKLDWVLILNLLIEKSSLTLKIGVSLGDDLRDFRNLRNLSKRGMYKVRRGVKEDCLTVFKLRS